MPTIKEMREVCQQKKMNSKGKMVWAGHWFNTLVNRHLSIYFTWLFVKLNISANTVTFMMIVLGVAGVPLLIPHILWLNVAGGLCLMMAELFDCVDGEVARWNRKSSLKGVYLDLVSHSLCNGIVSSLCALHLYYIHREPVYLILAFLAYFISQTGYTLKEEFGIIKFQMPSSVKSISPKENRETKGLLAVIKKKSRRLIESLINRMSVDHVLVRMLSVLGILISYLGTNVPMIVLSYWFIIAGGIGIMKEIISKYFVHIPDVGHVKKV